MSNFDEANVQWLRMNILEVCAPLKNYYYPKSKSGLSSFSTGKLLIFIAFLQFECDAVFTW